jgi:hypothetical protein
MECRDPAVDRQDREQFCTFELMPGPLSLFLDSEIQLALYDQTKRFSHQIVEDSGEPTKQTRSPENCTTCPT